MKPCRRLQILEFPKFNGACLGDSALDNGDPYLQKL